MNESFDMDDESWSRLRELLDVALTLDPAERSTWLDGLAARDAAFRVRLAGLLALHDSGDADALLGTLPRIDTGDFAPLPVPERSPGDSIGPYELIRLLGEGGMGSVWLARRADGLIDRPVALKLPRVIGERAALAARMARERRILAALSHENIARLYDAGVDAEGQPFLALEYVEGTPIDAFCKERNLGLRERLALFREVVNAVAYAHGKLVVHRDLKPANVLVTPDSRVKLLDFGIAKLLDDGVNEGTELTRFAGRPLTLEYASPEQVRGDAIGTASDIYSLGVLLFQILTDARPYRTRRNSRAELEEAILNGEPQWPSDAVRDTALRNRLRGDLDTIVLKALRKEPGQRYATANALAEDIGRFLAERPVLAQPDSRAYRLRKFLRRNRLGVGIAASVAVLVVAGITAVLWQAHVAIEERRKAEDIQQFISSIFTEANPDEHSGGPVTAVSLLQRARERVNRELADRPEQRAELLTTIGVSLADMQEVEEGRNALVEARDVATRAFGPDSLLALHARTSLFDLTRFDMSREEQKAECASLLRSLRAHDPDGAVLSLALSVQAYTQIDALEYEEALESAREAHSLALRAHGPAARETTRTTVLVATTAEDAHHLEEAEKFARQGITLALASSSGDPDASDSIQARVILARVLNAQGQIADSIAAFSSVTQSARRHFGEDSTEHAFYQVMLARNLLNVGQPDQAKSAIEVALPIFAAREKDGGGPLVPYAHLWHAQALINLRDATGALEEVTPALARYEKKAKADKPEFVRARLVTALADAYLARYPDGDAQFAAIPALKDPVLQAHVFVVRANFEHLRGDEAAAVTWARKAIDAAGTTVNAERTNALPVLGLALVGVNKLDEAERTLVEALEMSRKWQLGDSPERADAWLGMGEIAAARGDCARSQEQISRASEYWAHIGTWRPAPASALTARCAPHSAT